MKTFTKYNISKSLKKYVHTYNAAKKAFSDELHTPASFKDGLAFKNYVREKIFTKTSFDLLYKTQTFKTNTKHFPAHSPFPDFFMRDKKFRRPFYLEVKYRRELALIADPAKDQMIWEREDQLRSYNDIDDKIHPVFVIVGYEGTPHAPKLIVMGHIKNELTDYRIIPLDLFSHPELNADDLWQKHEDYDFMAKALLT